MSFSPSTLFEGSSLLPVGAKGLRTSAAPSDPGGTCDNGGLMNTPEDAISPYQPPASDLSQPVEATSALPPHERSAAPKVFGVLAIIFASIQLLFSTCGLLFSATAGAAENVGNAMARPMAK